MSVPETNMDAIGAYARGVREERGLTPEELAEQCGVSVNTIRNLERGASLSWQTLVIVLGKLGIRLKPEKVRQ